MAEADCSGKQQLIFDRGAAAITDPDGVATPLIRLDDQELVHAAIVLRHERVTSRRLDSQLKADIVNSQEQHRGLTGDQPCVP